MPVPESDTISPLNAGTGRNDALRPLLSIAIPTFICINEHIYDYALRPYNKEEYRQIIC